jgi:hypothetical protein
MSRLNYDAYNAQQADKLIVVYYKSRKRELKAKLMNESVR